jgi:hypothetical protein
MSAMFAKAIFISGGVAPLRKVTAYLTSPTVLIAQILPSIILRYFGIFGSSHVHSLIKGYLVNACLPRIAHGNDRARDETKLVADYRYGFHPAVGAGGYQVPPSVVVVKT